MSAGGMQVNARRTSLRRVAAMGATVSLLCSGAVFTASPASAVEKVFRSVNVAAVDCAKGEKLTIHSKAQGIVIHRWRLGPHPEDRSQGGRVGASLASVFDKTITSNRAVYSAVVIAKTYQNREPKIDLVFADCT